MIYHYIWLNSNGNKEEGDLEATSVDNAILILQKKGITTIVEVKEKVDKNSNVFGFFIKKLTIPDLLTLNVS